MNTLIVPVDFSETAVNAARYAAALSAELSPAKIVLYHSTIATDHEESATELPAEEAAENELKSLVNVLAAITPETEVETLVNDGYLLEQIKTLADDHNALFIVMGITGKNKLEQKLIGSNTTKIAQQSGYPVLVIPETVLYEPVEQMVLALQFKESLLEKVPAAAIRDMVTRLDAKLTILNIEDGNDDTPAQYVRAGQQAAHLMFDGMNATFEMLEAKNAVEGITGYTAQHKVQLIVSIAEEHSFFNHLLKGSTTNKLAYQSNIPLLVFKALK